MLLTHADDSSGMPVPCAVVGDPAHPLGEGDDLQHPRGTGGGGPAHPLDTGFC